MSLTKVVAYFDKETKVLKGVFWPNKKKYSDNDDLIALDKSKKFDDCLKLVMDEKIFNTDHEYTGQFYLDGDSLKKDEDKTETLMPVKLIKIKYLNRLNKDIDEELSKENPDLVKLMRLNRDKDNFLKLKKYDSEESKILYLKALEILPKDKTKIKKMIEERIK